MKDILSIRLNEQDKKDMIIIKHYLEEQCKNLPSFIREVTDTDVLKYAIILTSMRIQENANTDERN